MQQSTGDSLTSDVPESSWLEQSARVDGGVDPSSLPGVPEGLAWIRSVCDDVTEEVTEKVDEYAKSLKGIVVTGITRNEAIDHRYSACPYDQHPIVSDGIHDTP